MQMPNWKTCYYLSSLLIRITKNDIPSEDANRDHFVRVSESVTGRKRVQIGEENFTLKNSRHISILERQSLSKISE